MVLRETLDVDAVFQQNMLCCSELRVQEPTGMSGDVPGRENSEAEIFMRIFSGPCFRPGRTPTAGAEDWLDSRKHLGCLELRRSDIVQAATIALFVPAHDKATVDAACIPASK